MELEQTDGQVDSIEALERIDEYTVVDSDVHEIVAYSTEFARYVPEPYKNRVKHQLTTNDPLAKSLVGSFPFDLDPTPHELGSEVKTTTPEGIMAFMDRFNTDYVVLHGHQLEGITDVPEQDFAIALCQAYNDYLLDNFLDGNEGLKGSIRIAPQAPEKSAEEIRRLGDETDMVSVHANFSSNTLLGDPQCEPIFEAAADVGLPMDYHPSFPNPPWGQLYGVANLQTDVANIAAYNQAAMSLVSNIVFQGIPEKYPDVEHVFLEGGVAWIPWLVGRMDKNYERRKDHLPWLEQKPSEYVREYFYWGTQPLEDPAGGVNLKQLMQMIGIDSLLYTSDFPHLDFDYPTVLTIPKLTPEEERKVFGENALSVLDI
ncbi:amidohydrolase family protein [Natronobiforma cellulositropha]|uniref:amidohydrolase family protein n=1 Tax=Natronobiforma cellulositropha TaxID=1679076 RepID=UPI0021D5E997|nr:amidohydrolase family protein [Natronobiforma cellulositropha]